MVSKPKHWLMGEVANEKINITSKITGCFGEQNYNYLN